MSPLLSLGVYVCNSVCVSRIFLRNTGSVEGKGEKKKNKIDLPHSLQCCNRWVCASVSLCFLVPQLQGRHQVFKIIQMVI